MSELLQRTRTTTRTSNGVIQGSHVTQMRDAHAHVHVTELINHPSCRVSYVQLFLRPFIPCVVPCFLASLLAHLPTRLLYLLQVMCRAAGPALERAWKRERAERMLQVIESVSQ